MTLVVALGLSAAALGAPQRVGDRRGDTEGRFDLRAARGGSHCERAAGCVQLHRIRTFARWSKHVLQADNETYFDIQFDINGDGSPDRYLEIDVGDDGRIHAVMHRDPTGAVMGEAAVRRPDRYSVEVRFPIELLGPHVRSYRWNATSLWHRPSHPHCGFEGDTGTVCVDSVPSSGWAAAD